MKLSTIINGRDYQLDLENPISIAIPLKFNGEQPNHFSAQVASRKPLSSGDFVGDTKQGGSCNVEQITMVPHCNGTHTESIHHVVDDNINIGSMHKNSISYCQLISIEPETAENTNDSYTPKLDSADYVISRALLIEAMSRIYLKNSNAQESELGQADSQPIEALVVRTLPNQDHKLSVIYSENTQPPFFTREAMEWLAKTNIKHLLVDFPSLDRMYDDGHLTNHHIFWNLEEDSHQLNPKAKIERTVTEMVYVTNDVADGFYALNLQLPAFELDAAPSRPMLYPFIKIKQEDLNHE